MKEYVQKRKTYGAQNIFKTEFKKEIPQRPN